MTINPAQRIFSLGNPKQARPQRGLYSTSRWLSSAEDAVEETPCPESRLKTTTEVMVEKRSFETADPGK